MVLSSGVWVILGELNFMLCWISLSWPMLLDGNFLNYLETTGHPLSAFHLTVVLLSPQVLELLFSSQYGGSHQTAGSAHSGRHHGHQTLLLWPHHP